MIISPLNKCVRSSPIAPFWWEAMAVEEMVRMISGDPQRMVQFLRAITVVVDSCRHCN